jgi:glycosyltransferase involved in cell wall biosynthesis
LNLTISIVMPTYNRRETLEHVLPTILNQTYPKDAYEILLSDSGSTDGTREMVEAMNIPNLRMITGENRGRSGARNRGICEAKGDIILFTDADILADPHLLEEHAKIHSAKRNTAVVGREVQVDTLKEYKHVMAYPEESRCLHSERTKELSWLFFLTGNASAPKEALVRVGMFDENFTGYGHEDLELGYRLKKSGMRIAYNIHALNYHWHPVPFEEKCQKMHMSGVSTVRFYRKHKDPMIKLLMGVNPVTMALHSVIAENGSLIKRCRRKAAESPSCREIVFQHSYLSGVKAALRDPSL